MDGPLQRYLDGITLLVSIVAGELFVLALPAGIESARWLWGLGFGAVVWTLVAGYQRGIVGDPDDD